MFAASEEQIKAWKQKHGEVFEVEIGGRRCYLKRADRQTLGMASVTSKGDPVLFNEAILANCWLAGDESIKTEDELFLGLGEVIKQMVERTKAVIKKI